MELPKLSPMELQETAPMDLQELLPTEPAPVVPELPAIESMEPPAPYSDGVEPPMAEGETAADAAANLDLARPAPEMDQTPQLESEVPQVDLNPSAVESAPLASRVFLDGPILVDVGEEFVLIVKVTDVFNLFSAPMFVNYDSNLLDYQLAEEGGFLSLIGEPTVFTTSPNPAQGRIIIGYKQAAGGGGISGSGDLCRLVFIAKQPGKAAVSLDRVNFSDPAGNRLPVSVEGALIEIR
jgi:general secretion pathway protein D